MEVRNLQKNAVLWATGQSKRRIPALVVMTVCYTANSLLSVAFALETRQVIDSAVSGDSPVFLRACLLLALCIAAILALTTIARHLHDKLTADMDRDWKEKLLHGLLHGDYESVRAYHTGELLNRMNNDVRIFTSSMLSIVPSLASMVTKLVAAMAVLIALEPMMTLVALGGGLVVILATGLVRRRLKALNKQVSQQEGRVSGFLQETLEKLLMVQAMDVADEMERRSGILLRDRYQIQRKRKNISLLSNLCVSILSYGASFGTLAFCAYRLLHGTMSFGTLTAVSQLVGQLQGPLVNLSGIIPQYTAMAAAAERLWELESLKQEPVTRKDPAVLMENATALSGKGLTFAYDRDPVFTQGEFTVPLGAFAVVTGPSGIGKSTLLKLLLGIFPYGGSLALDRPGDPISLDRSTRRLFAYVPQGNLLLSGTLRENLTITRTDATEEEIRQAIYVSNMDAYLDTLPHGLDTVMGESGAGLSEGQAQRLSIARAVLSQAPILLLDEATSALDPDTEITVLRRLRALPGKTCIAVTHRAAAETICTHRIRIQDGKIYCESAEESSL